jgi:hypothetical protein
MSARKRKYHKSAKIAGKNSDTKTFILRYQDLAEGDIHNDGPYNSESVAIEKLNSFLKKGICSWLVSYNG